MSLFCTVTFRANSSDNLTRSPSHIFSDFSGAEGVSTASNFDALREALVGEASAVANEYAAESTEAVDILVLLESAAGSLAGDLAGTLIAGPIVGEEEQDLARWLESPLIRRGASPGALDDDDAGDDFRRMAHPSASTARSLGACDMETITAREQFIQGMRHSVEEVRGLGAAAKTGRARGQQAGEQAGEQQAGEQAQAQARALRGAGNAQKLIAWLEKSAPESKLQRRRGVYPEIEASYVTMLVLHCGVWREARDTVDRLPLESGIAASGSLAPSRAMLFLWGQVIELRKWLRTKSLAFRQGTAFRDLAMEESRLQAMLDAGALREAEAAATAPVASSTGAGSGSSSSRSAAGRSPSRGVARGDSAGASSSSAGRAASKVSGGASSSSNPMHSAAVDADAKAPDGRLPTSVIRQLRRRQRYRLPIPKTFEQLVLLMREAANFATTFLPERDLVAFDGLESRSRSGPAARGEGAEPGESEELDEPGQGDEDSPRRERMWGHMTRVAREAFGFVTQGFMTADRGQLGRAIAVRAQRARNRIDGFMAVGCFLHVLLADTKAASDAVPSSCALEQMLLPLRSALRGKLAVPVSEYRREAACESGSDMRSVAALHHYTCHLAGCSFPVAARVRTSADALFTQLAEVLAMCDAALSAPGPPPGPPGSAALGGGPSATADVAARQPSSKPNCASIGAAPMRTALRYHREALRCEVRRSFLLFVFLLFAHISFFAHIFLLIYFCRRTSKSSPPRRKHRWAFPRGACTAISWCQKWPGRVRGSSATSTAPSRVRTGRGARGLALSTLQWTSPSLRAPQCGAWRLTGRATTTRCSTSAMYYRASAAFRASPSIPLPATRPRLRSTKRHRRRPSGAAAPRRLPAPGSRCARRAR